MLTDPFGDLVSTVLMQDQAGGSAILAGFERELRARAFIEKMPFRNWKHSKRRLVGEPDIQSVGGRCYVEHQIRAQLIAAHQPRKAGRVDRDLLTVPN